MSKKRRRPNFLCVSSGETTVFSIYLLYLGLVKGDNKKSCKKEKGERAWCVSCGVCEDNDFHEVGKLMRM